MKKQTIFMSVCLAAILILTGLATAAPRPMIEAISFEAVNPEIDRVTFKLNGAHLPTTFALKGDRPRVVFDFPGTVPTKAVKNSIKADGSFIKQIRVGIHRGKKAKTRVVFDLRSNDPVDFKQDFDATTNTLAISVFTPGTDLTPRTEQPAAQPEAMETAPPAPKTEQEVKPLPEPEPMALPEPAPVPEPEAKTEIPPQAQDFMPGNQNKSQAEPVMKEPQVSQPPPPLPGPQPLPEPEPLPAIESQHEEGTTIQPLSEIGNKETPMETTAPVLNSIEFDKESNRGEMIIFKLNSFNPPVVFGIEEDVPRVVCFFKDTGAGEHLRDLINTDGRFVKSIRVGKYHNPDNIRVVLDLVPSHNYDLQQVFFKEDNTFMIIIDAAGDKQPNQGM